jgi:hypothetical protein
VAGIWFFHLLFVPLLKRMVNSRRARLRRAALDNVFVVKL